MMSPASRRADARLNYDRLLAAAAVALNADGVNASLDDIAKAAGVGNATLYRHFPTREKLIEAVYGQWFERLCAAAGELAQTREPADALRDWLRHVATQITESRVLANAFMATYDGPAGSMPPQMAAWHDELYDAALPLLTAAKQAGAIRADLSVTELLALTTAVARAGNPAQAGRFLDMLLEGITPRSVVHPRCGDPAARAPLPPVSGQPASGARPADRESGSGPPSSTQAPAAARRAPRRSPAPE